jgi:bacterial/archaeal transporter family-2 protein
MRWSLYLLTVLIGIVLAIHLAMNGRVGSALNNARVGNALFWCVGALAALMIGATGWHAGTLAPLKEINPILLGAGILGACLVFGIAWLIPRIGAGSVMIVMLAGQVVGGMTISKFGWLGSPIQPISLRNIIGAMIMFGGVVLATRS